MTEALYGNGFSVDELLPALGLHEEAYDPLVKYNPDQPRIPAGGGVESGRWTTGSASTEAAYGSVTFASTGLVSRSAPLFAPSLGVETLDALAEFAPSVGFAATLGILFVPSPNATTSGGPLPGDTENSYSYDRDEGVLRVLGPTGFVLAAGHKDGSGVFYDANTSVPFAREINGALIFDGGAIQGADAAPRSSTRADEDADEDEPKLYPAPGLDQPGWASDRAKAYQEQISMMINPQRPLPYGLAMNLINPVSGKLVHFDECDEHTGTMIEAKGPGFDGLLSFPAGAESVSERFLDQGTRELQAAGPREVTWYFAESRAAQFARALFSSEGLERITVKVQPQILP